MKSAILYAADKKYTRSHYKVGREPNCCWMRMEIVDGTPEEALAKAKPYQQINPGAIPLYQETVLNTIPWPLEKRAS